MMTVRIPMTIGRTIARTTIASRTQPGSTKLGRGTAASRNDPASGTMTPTSATTQASDPNVISASSSCLLWGTRPKSSTLAQPSSIVTTLPANRPAAAKIPPMMAMARPCGRQR
jgi:hypothetical protein